MPPGQLRARMHDQELHDEIRKADVVFGVHPATGERNGPYYGIAALKRIVRRNASEDLRVLTLPVDPATDDVEVACAMVQVVKGAHCYDAFTKKD